jgi:hypothetical protein
MAQETGVPMPPPTPLPTFWNLSNHGLRESWTAEQIAAAKAWGEGAPNHLEDFPFPQVDPTADIAAVVALAARTLAGLQAAGARPGEAVMLMGEFTLACALVPRLQAAGLVPVVATSVREARASVEADGSVVQEHRFRFVRFRPYAHL